MRDLGFPFGGLPRSPVYLVYSHSEVQDLVGEKRLNIRLLPEILPKAWSPSVSHAVCKGPSVSHAVCSLLTPSLFSLPHPEASNPVASEYPQCSWQYFPDSVPQLCLWQSLIPAPRLSSAAQSLSWFLSSAHVLESDGSVFRDVPLTSFRSCLSKALDAVFLLHPHYLLRSWPLSNF